MSVTADICTRTFEKIFINLAKSDLCKIVNNEVAKIQIGILYTSSVAHFLCYKEFKDATEIDIADYLSFVEAAIAESAIHSTIGQAGTRYAKELGCDLASIKIIMQHREKQLPRAVLLKDDVKVRDIDILTEFLKN